MADLPADSALIDAVIQEFNDLAARDPMFFLHGMDIGKCATTAQVLELPRERQVGLVRVIVDREVEAINRRQGSLELKMLLAAVLRKKLPFSGDDLEALVRSLARMEHSGWWEALSPATILRCVEEHVAAHGLTASFRQGLALLASRLRQHEQHYAIAGKLLQRVDKLLANHPVAADGTPVARPPKPGVELTTAEPWVVLLRERLGKLDEPARQHWQGLLALCQQATAAKPSAKWLKQAQALVTALGTSFRELARAVFGEVGKMGPVEQGPPNALGFTADATQVHSTHSDLLRGLVWAASLDDNEALTAALGDTAEVCFKKLPGIGPRAPKIGNACLWALSNMSTPTAVAQLGRIKAKAKHSSVQKQLGKAMDTAAEKTGMSAADLEEVAVPSFGLTAVGECRKPLGDCTALLTIADGDVELSWLRADGKPQASVPAAVKEQYAEDVKALKLVEKEIAKQLPAQRARLERLFSQERTWSLADWQARFLDHPLVGTLARRLIWRFTTAGKTVGALWHASKLLDVQGQAIPALSESTRVALWHPIHASADEVRAWRERLEALDVRQPFKQAHREVYILTDAERTTAVYSNRFAAHILKQHQFNALCFERGWRYQLMGEWDSANTPTLHLPSFGLRAEFWVEGIRQRGALLERSDVSHHMVYLYLTTDQVRFYQGNSVVPLAVADVPPLAFSEVMRDADLFVGVASVGNDPNWQDGGLLGQFGEYWEVYSFGALFPSAQTRKAVLEKIVPRLKIADRCSFTDRFLVVRGDLRTYQIHLGSGSIKMSPNDQYLCIVPDRKAAGAPGKVYLPFEGDGMLSVILSKAVLLAADAKITDPSIVRQIRPPATT